MQDFPFKLNPAVQEYWGFPPTMLHICPTANRYVRGQGLTKVNRMRQL